ncbi:MAG: amidohydrolase [Candidatus Odinarchaeota archaeon]
MDAQSLRKKLFYGGPILTLNDSQPKAEAVGIEGEKILAVGSLDYVKNLLKKDYDLINLNGFALLPGFTDCHLHPILYTLYFLFPDLTNISSLEELKSLLKDSVKGKGETELLIGFNLSEEKFKNPVLPTRWDLDDACPEHPVFILRYDSHIGIANSKALELAEIHEGTKIPDGGEFRRDHTGKLNGIITEKAINIILSKVKFPKAKEIESAATKAFESFAKKGLTSLHSILSADRSGEFGDVGAIELPLFKYLKEKVLQNCYILVNVEKLRKLFKIKKSYLDGEKIDSKFKIGGLKLFLDGSFGAKTACMFEPFSDAPDMCGFCVIEEEEIYEKMKLAHNNGLQIVIHAIGDKGNRVAMNLYKRLLEEFPRENHRHRIEHASMLTSDVLNDMRKYGIIASCQPPFINSEYMWLEKRLGKERCEYTYPFKSIIDAGVMLISGSDCPIEDPSPILGIHALVTRNDFIPEQCISIEEAIKTYTINAAYAAFEEDIKGTIEVGKLADLVVLTENPMDVPKEKIKEIQVIETIVRGKSVFKNLIN